MLRLVRVTPEDLDVLFELVCLVEAETEDKVMIMAGLRNIADHFKATGESVVRMVFPADLFKQVVQVVNAPFMPADAAKLGIPENHYLYMVSRLPGIQSNFAQPEYFDPDFANVTPKQNEKTYLN